MKKAKSIGFYLAVMLLVVLLCTLMLLGAMLIPQDMVKDNLIRSGELMSEQGIYPRVVDSENASQLDNFTENIIIMQCSTLNAQKPASVFLNTLYITQDIDPSKNISDSFSKSILEYLKDGSDDMIEGYYVRYWGGFRAPLRLLLTVSDWQEIRRLTLFLMFTLMALVTCSICKNLNQRYAMAFAISVILLKPYIIGQVVDFVWCYYLAFVGMLLVPWMVKHQEYVPVFFMVIGMLTQYFDFYTAPLTTYGFPMIYLLLFSIKQGKSEKELIKQIFSLAGMWVLGYVGMWLAKLTLTSLFTEVNALADGISAFLDRVGIVRIEGGYDTGYSVVNAFKMIFFTIMGGKKGFAVYCLIGLSTVLAVLMNWKRKKTDLPGKIKKNRVMLVMVLFPLVWFIATAGPVIVHHWFQYRIIATAYFAAFAFAASCMEE